MAMTYYCEKCHKTMDEKNFYSSNNLEKYPNGKFHQCKKCLTMHVNNWEPDTYLWILQEADVPYIPSQWYNLMEKYGRDKSKLTGATILGRYLGKMRMIQYKDYRWKDTEFLKEKEQNELKQAMKDLGYDQQEITKTLEDPKYNIPDPNEVLEIPSYVNEPEPAVTNKFSTQPQEDYFAEVDNTPDIDIDLSDEEKLRLRLKWGKGYKPTEWVQLEQLYDDMMKSYDIQTAGHFDTLKFICKTSLKMNQLIDIGDVDGFQKMSKVYDSLMKSGKFTAAQNKAENGEFVDSVGELIALCERDGYIERFYSESPNDKVDITLQDMQRYTRRLVEEETNLNELLQAAIERNAKEDAEAKDEDDIVDFDDMAMQDIENQITTDKDFEEFADFQSKEMDEDELKQFAKENPK